MRSLVLLAAMLPAPTPGFAQDTLINVQHYVIGVDVPEPPSLVALGVAPPLRLGSAPKPFAAGLLIVATGGSTVRAVSVDASPYFLFGGGVRSLRSYRSMSVAGRLTRVLTKTLLSVGAATASDDPSVLSLGLALRSTLHDPHDPIASSRLVEDVSMAFAAAGAEPLDAANESVADRGVDVTAAYALSRRVVRARRGDAMVSAGWGVRVRAAGGMLSRDSLGSPHHTAWITAQYTFGARYDLVGTAEARDAFGALSRYVGSLALRRKGTSGDFQVGARYDARHRVLHPGILLDLRLGGRLGAVAWVDTDADAGQSTSARRLRLGIMTRWFSAVDRPVP